jgi:hypothetical protein
MAHVTARRTPSRSASATSSVAHIPGVKQYYLPTVHVQATRSRRHVTPKVETAPDFSKATAQKDIQTGTEAYRPPGTGTGMPTSAAEGLGDSYKAICMEIVPWSRSVGASVNVTNRMPES